MPTSYRFRLQSPAALVLIVAIFSALVSGLNICAFAQSQTATGSTSEFPPELVDWTPGPDNPIFTPGGTGCWDLRIRERGWILREGDSYHLWYTGYDGTRQGTKLLGYAISNDGLNWRPSPKNPLCRSHWVEDVMVIKHGDTYYMFAEGAANGHAELLTSKNRVDWNWEGPLEVRMADGKRDAEQPCGTPTVWHENGVWYLFYERHDLGVWLATSNNPLSGAWTNVQDEPVLIPGPADYDKQLIALDQIIKHDGAYFAFYHACGKRTPRTWNTNVARSTDLIHWRKYPDNPIVEDNKSSGILVADGRGFRLYTMHEQVDVFYSRANKLRLVNASRIVPMSSAANGQ
jgi:beta-1,2-mannobiose phosphorylase / 1,2-beta-oligomannan phosphorylase